MKAAKSEYPALVIACFVSFLRTVTAKNVLRALAAAQSFAKLRTALVEALTATHVDRTEL